jgi:hypothetical protein
MVLSWPDYEMRWIGTGLISSSRPNSFRERNKRCLLQDPSGPESSIETFAVVCQCMEVTLPVLPRAKRLLLGADWVEVEGCLDSCSDMHMPASHHRHTHHSI